MSFAGSFSLSFHFNKISSTQSSEWLRLHLWSQREFFSFGDHDLTPFTVSYQHSIWMDLWIISHHSIPGINPTWSLYMSLLMYFWIWFANFFFLRIFASMFVSDIALMSLCEFFCVVLVSGCGEGNSNPLQCSCLENPRDRGAWWAALSGVAQCQTRLKRLSNSSSIRMMLAL